MATRSNITRHLERNRPATALRFKAINLSHSPAGRRQRCVSKQFIYLIYLIFSGILFHYALPGMFPQCAAVQIHQVSAIPPSWTMQRFGPG